MRHSPGLAVATLHLLVDGVTQGIWAGSGLAWLLRARKQQQIQQWPIRNGDFWVLLCCHTQHLWEMSQGMLVFPGFREGNVGCPSEEWDP